MRKIIDLVVISLIMLSCSGIPKEKKVTVSNVGISGALKDFVKVIDGTYTFTNNGEEAFITVQFELVNESKGKILPNLDKTNGSNIILQVLNEKGNYIELGVYGFSADEGELEKLNDLISKGKAGDKKRISFTMSYFDENDNGKLIFKEAASFEIVDKAFSYNSVNDDSENITSETGENWDAMLNSYEKYVDQYIAYVRKVNNGDMSAMTEYTNFLERTTDLADKMEKAKGQLSSEQLKRYLNITNKFTAGIVDIEQ